jgi:hypothetical protein
MDDYEAYLSWRLEGGLPELLEPLLPENGDLSSLINSKSRSSVTTRIIPNIDPFRPFPHWGTQESMPSGYSEASLLYRECCPGSLILLVNYNSPPTPPRL